MGVFGGVRFGEVVVETRVCGLDGVVFGKVCRDVDVGGVGVEHFEMGDGGREMGGRMVEMEVVRVVEMEVRMMGEWTRWSCRGIADVSGYARRSVRRWIMATTTETRNWASTRHPEVA